MLFAEVPNPFADPWNALWAGLTLVLGWFGAKGFDKLIIWLRESGKLWDERQDASLKHKQSEKKLDIEERIDRDKLKSQKDLEIISGWKNLLDNCTQEKEHLIKRHTTELDNILVEMKAIRAEHKVEMTELRKQHEMCIEEHAVAKTEREALNRECIVFKASLAQLNQKYENLKRRVGGSDFISEIAPEKKSD